MQGFQLIINFIVLPLFFFSSALFPVPDLPGAMRVVVRLNPLSVISGLQGNNVRYLEAGNWDRVERSAAELDGMSRGFERTIGREFASGSPTTRAQAAAVQVGSIRPALSQRVRCGSQHLQLPTPPHLPIHTADLPGRSDRTVARCRRSGMTRGESWL
jgi:ABC-2 type transporter